MSYQVLARKYRPQKFSDVIGQEHVTRTLMNAIEQGRIAHGYIFSGHRGIGKTTVARILAMALNCRSAEKPVSEPCGKCDSCAEIRAGSSVDVIEIDAATNRGIDEIRELREAARYRPARDRFKIYILDEAHQITDAAFNALLKTLEEPPSHVVFMLATTAPEDIPQTIRSRCQHFSFRAVTFQDILGQLRDLTTREGIKSDENALALLAEAGDGSMRDALSILDQAIAASTGNLTLEGVRQLIGAAPSQVLEKIMQAVARSSSEEVLRTVDQLISEGQNPTHFARHLVRFLRNATVAKVAGKDSSLLQISGDERDRVARVAELFSEEDLARHLQIMLRTHSELSYRQEQRFHLELGLLKMSHAQRLLPMEELLSGSVATPAPLNAKANVLPSVVGGTEPRRSDTSSRGNVVSPFAADTARKSGSKPEMSADSSSGHRAMPTVASAAPVVMGSAAPNVEVDPAPAAVSTTEEDPQPDVVSTAELRGPVLNALGGQPMLVAMLEGGEWNIEGNDLVVKVASSSAVIDMSVSAEARRTAGAAASGLLGRPVRLKVVPGGTAQVATGANRSNSHGRTKAEQDPIVRKFQQKFGAEIRTIIDYTKKK